MNKIFFNIEQKEKLIELFDNNEISNKKINIPMKFNEIFKTNYKYQLLHNNYIKIKKYSVNYEKLNCKEKNSKKRKIEISDQNNFKN